jgi:dolichyl-phosphate beta-glucosyltransferase
MITPQVLTHRTSQLWPPRATEHPITLIRSRLLGAQMAKAQLQLGLVVPVYDEIGRLADYTKLLVDFVAERGAGELLFVDDGSTDGTPDELDELIAGLPGAPAGVLRLPHAGKGRAVTAGLRALDAPFLGFCDLDLATPLDDLERIAAAAVHADGLAMGSRGLTTSTLVKSEGPLRETLGRAYNRLLQATVTPGVVDTQCGAKVAPRAVWEAVLPHCRELGFAWDAEVVAVALALGIKVVEVPVSWRHDERSKVRLGRDGMAMVAATPRIRRSAKRAAGPCSGFARSPVAAAASSPGGDTGEVFDDTNASVLAAFDQSHWWYRSKAALVATALRRTAPDGAERGLLVDIGGGSGGVTAMLGWPPDRVVVVEGHLQLATHARRRHGLNTLQASVRDVPLADRSAEVVCLLDVIEHLHDPVATLRESARLLAPGGRLVVNVPAHQWLWSTFDEELGHVRRYSRAALDVELAGARLRPLVLTHVFSWLVPPTLLMRRLLGGDSVASGHEHSSLVFDRAALALTFAERSLLARVSLPFGTSVLCVATPAT